MASKESSSSSSTTAALFVPICESLLLSLICSFLLHAFFSSMVAADYAPSARYTLTATMIVNIFTVLMHIGVAAAFKTSKILTSSSQKWLTYHQSLGIANAHCCASCALFVLYLLLFLQVAAFWDQLDTSTKLQRGPSYTSTQLNDWRQAIVGTSGEWQALPGNKNMFQAIPPSQGLPIAGSLYSGIIIAYLLVMFFVAVYASFMAMPEEASSYMFFEPKFLIMLNAMLVMTAGYAVKSCFVYCYCSGDGCFSPATLCVLFSLFAAITSFADVLVGLMIPERWYSLGKLVVMAVMAIIPAFASVIVQGISSMFRATAWMLCILSLAIAGLEYWLHLQNPETPAASSTEQDVPVAKPIGFLEDEKDQKQAEDDKLKAPSVVPKLRFTSSSSSAASWLLPLGSAAATPSTMSKQHFA